MTAPATIREAEDLARTWDVNPLVTRLHTVHARHEADRLAASIPGGWSGLAREGFGVWAPTGCVNCGQRIAAVEYSPGCVVWHHPDEGSHTVCRWKKDMAPTDVVATPYHPSTDRGPAAQTARKHTVYKLCAAHQGLAGDRDLAKIFGEGGPGWGGPCTTGDSCKIRPGTDRWVPEVCLQRDWYDTAHGDHSFRWAVNARSAA